MMKFIRYFLVGGTAAAINLAIFATLVRGANVPIYAAATVSFVLATLVNYILSVRFVFVSGSRFSRKREIAAVYLVSIIGLLANQSILLVLVDWARQDAILAQAAALAALFLWNYSARHFYVFRRIARPGSDG